MYDKKLLDSILEAVENVLSLPHFEGHFFKQKSKQKNGAIYKSLHLPSLNCSLPKLRWLVSFNWPLFR